MKRAPRHLLGQILRGLHLLSFPFSSPRSIAIREGEVVAQRRGQGGISYDLVVVDEAHHVYASEESREAVERFVSEGSRRMLLSDISQAREEGRGGVMKLG